MTNEILTFKILALPNTLYLPTYERKKKTASKTFEKL